MGCIVSGRWWVSPIDPVATVAANMGERRSGMTKRIVITGGTGFLGTVLARSLSDRGDDVHVLERGEGPDRWDPAAGRLDPELLTGAGAVVNLSGAGIGDKRWTDARKDLILRSRTDSTGLLAGTMAAMDQPPAVFVSASAIGYYGDTGDDTADEQSPPGEDFQARVCVAWEAAAAPASEAGVRVVHPRSGIVLADGQGALGPMAPLFKFGVGGKLGDGSQWWSWITLRDEIRAIEHLIDGDLSGPVNLAAPNPVRNTEFTKAMGKALGRPTILPVPKFALDIRLGKELAESLGYGSVRVSSQKLQDSGFTFTSPTIDVALAEVFG
jgi:uncharacterized protein